MGGGSAPGAAAPPPSAAPSRIVCCPAAARRPLPQPSSGRRHPGGRRSGGGRSARLPMFPQEPSPAARPGFPDTGFPCRRLRGREPPIRPSPRTSAAGARERLPGRTRTVNTPGRAPAFGGRGWAPCRRRGPARGPCDGLRSPPAASAAIL